MICFVNSLLFYSIFVLRNPASAPAMRATYGPTRDLPHVWQINVIILLESLYQPRSQAGRRETLGTRFVQCLGPVVQRVDNAIHRMNRYPVDKC